MPELRLLDPDGYTVPGTAQNVPDADVEAVRARLLTEIAPVHAAQWDDFGYRADAYRIHPETSALPDGQQETPVLVTDETTLITVTAYHNQYDHDLRFLGRIVIGSRVACNYDEFMQAREYFLGMADTDYIECRPACHWNDKDS